MMKKYKSFIFLGLAIIILIAGVVIISGLEAPVKTPEDYSELIEVFSVNKDDIASVTVENEYGIYSFEYKDAVKIKGIDAEKDDEKIKYLLTEISGVYAQSIAAEGEIGLESYGLSPYKASVVIFLKDGSEETLYFGDKTPSESGRYLMKKGDSKIYIAGNYSSDTAFRKLDYYRTTDLFNFDVTKVTALSFEKGGKKVSFKKNGKAEADDGIFAAFNMITPYDWEAESTEIEKVLDYLNSLTISEYVKDNADNLSEYKIGIAKVTVEVNGKNEVLNIGSNKDGKLYVTKNNGKSVYLVESKGFEFLDYEPTAFLQQFVLLRSIDNVKRLDYTHNDINAQFEIKKVGDETHDIKYKGKLVNQKSFKALYTELISMSTSGTVNYTPSGVPLMEYTFNYNNGKRDVVSYYKYDERKIAVSINGVVNFYVDSSEFKLRCEKIDNIIKNEL